eukprot:Gb_11421 [translate_table: standard]
MELVIAAVICLLMMLFTWMFITRFQQRKLNLPPGPASLPIIGNMHMLGKLPHRALNALSKKYGPLMFMRLGLVPTVVVSSPDMAKEILKTHDRVFASRPMSSATKYLFYNASDVAFAPYGAYWRQMRKVCVSELLSPERIKSCGSVREEVVSFMIQSILEDSVKGSNPVNVSKKVAALAADMTCRMTFGRKYSNEIMGSEGFRAAIQEATLLMGAFNIGDFIPYLGWMDVQGLNRRFCKTHKTLDAFFEKIIEEHAAAEAQRDGLNMDFVDVLLAISNSNDMEIKVTRDSIKALMLDMLSAGVDTSSATLEWAMSELLRNPSVINKVQDELRSVIEPNRRVQESDLPCLPYLQAVVKETLRLYPAGPLLIAHEATKACNVSGYEIPASTRVIVNAWAIGRNPKSWEDADKFRPERFIGNSKDVRGQDFDVIPFGSGRRGCPGMNLGIVVVELALAQLVHCFDWRLPDGMDAQMLDMSEAFGLAMPRATHLFAVATPRLSI